MSKKSVAVLLVLMSMLVSCAIPIKEEARDRDSTYRGFWGAEILETPSQSLAVSYLTQCWQIRKFGNLQIAGGRVVARVNGFDLTGFVKKNGKFTANLSLANGSVLRFRGKLDSVAGIGKGTLTQNLEGQGLAGCTSKVKLKKAPI